MRPSGIDPSTARRLDEADRAHLWHPFTAMQAWLAEDDGEGRIIAAGEGFELIDTHGRRYIDGFSSLWCNLHGHRTPQIDEAIRRQLDRIAHATLLGHGSVPSIELATRLVQIAPKGLTKVFFSDSGATAVEVALKMAFQYYRNLGQMRRRRFVALRYGYHGDTLGAVSVGGIETFHAIFRALLFETTFADSPNPYHHPAGDKAGEAVLEQIDAILAAGAGEYCAVIVEPLIQAAGGMLTHPRGFFSCLRELTIRRDVLLIADEVATGFCRTGKLFGCEHEAVTPDLMCLGKGLTGGYLPVAATLATQEIFDAFLGEPTEGRTFYHGHTFTGNALGCAAAAASIELIFSSGLLETLPAKVDLIARRLAGLADHPHVGDVRQCGMMVGIELVADRQQRRPFPPSQLVGARVCRRARQEGILIRPLGDVVVLMPAPAMDTGTLERLLDATVATIKEFEYPAAS
jgi:adenosylmethionine-8-amino-7-oxononanoate aminotransferase